MRKGYLLGVLCALLLGLLTWKLLFPQITGLDGIYFFFLGFFCLWTAAACLLGFVDPDSSKGYRWGYAAIFLAFFLNQVFHASGFYSLFNLLLIFTLFLVQRLERRDQDD